ncbi:glycine betaine ABC transporter substrate-binding protein [Peribacillus cavernae]|uniref:Glycine betaine ABC transporter substrate-binding protein n=1 Tax=Peribacillus cavernae TaxID=1674310 RepID=A0A3S0VXC2_9BACI|nr:glycine betaine ABC transporter substrate-binding protein [Peribacillus cavernae]MDQ0217677.1 osmoprotectant transport system substrate-binding protein [Peribacillus cavernae]RUQ28150.1 glycine betaine ABC transporter substrate-binding protein [Peribacillus cavernae]
MKKFILVVCSLLLVSALAACSSKSTAGSGESKGKVTVGGKDFTEQHILTKMTSIYLKEKGYQVDEASSMGSTVARSALENGQLDVYWEYTGTGLMVYLKQPVETDPQKAYEKVKEADKKNGLTWLNKSEFNNTYAILMRQDQAKKLGIASISDLAEYINKDSSKYKFATNSEFYAREDGLKALQKKYGFAFPQKNVVKMDTGLLYNSLKEEQVDIAVGFATDGRIKGFDLVVLEDNEQFFPAYNGVPVIREEVLKEQPEVGDLLNEMADRLDGDTMKDLNYRVDVKHEDVNKVAREWLVEQGMLD